MLYGLDPQWFSEEFQEDRQKFQDYNESKLISTIFFAEEERKKRRKMRLETYENGCENEE